MSVLSKAITVFVVSLIAISAAVTPALAQDSQTAWLEGTVLDENGKLWDGGALTVTVIAPDGKEVAGGEPERGDGGLYSIRNLPPGTYEVRLSRNTDHSQAPQRVFGVVLVAGQRTTLNFVSKPGEKVIEIGKPVVVTQTAIVVSRELKRLQDRIDQLENEIASLKKSSQ